MMRPYRARIMTDMACCAHKCAPVRFVRSTASQSSAFIRTARPSRVMAALFTRMSSLPNFSIVCRNPAFTCSASATSIATASASPPAGGDFSDHGREFFRISRGRGHTRARLRQRKRGGAPDSL